MKREKIVPDLVLSSSAKQAPATAKAVAEARGYDKGILDEANLYFHGAQAYLEALSKLPDSCERVLVVGHNPDVEDVLRILIGLEEALPTATIAHIALPTDVWSAIDSGIQGELLALWHPRGKAE